MTDKIECLIEMDYHKEVVQEQVETARTTLLQEIDSLQRQIAALARENWRLTEEKARLEGFISGYVDIIAEDHEDTKQMAEDLAKPIGEAKRARARCLFHALVRRKEAMMRGEK